jgi:hypothetical protein
MGALGGLIGSLFTGLAGWFAAFMGQKLAVVVAAVTGFGILTVALFAGLATLLSSLVSAFPTAHIFTTFMWVAIPDQVPVGISAIIAADAAVALYKWNVKNLDFAAQ